jgi:hypothetical protein
VFLVASLDGYPYAFLGARGSPSWPQMTDKSQWLYSRPAGFRCPKIQECQISLDICFPIALNRASEVFKHVAFENPQCGDCSTFRFLQVYWPVWSCVLIPSIFPIPFFSMPSLLVIRQLVISSGKKGLEAFLPPTHRVAFAGGSSSPAADGDDGGDRDPFLPLESSWKQIDFSLKSVLAPWVRNPPNDTETAEVKAGEPGHGDDSHRAAPQLRSGGVNVREWAMRAMARYRFVLGGSIGSSRTPRPGIEYFPRMCASN